MTVQPLMRGALTISGKVRIAQALALLIILALGATALARTLIVARRVERFAGEQFPDTILLAQIAQGRLEAERAANAAFALGGRSAELRDELDSEVEIAFAAVDEGLTSYESRPRRGPMAADWASVAQAIHVWQEAVARFLAVSRTAADRGAPGGAADDATLAAWQVARACSQDVEKALLSYMTRVEGEVQEVRVESTTSTRVALWFISLALLTGVSAQVVGGRLLRRSVTRTVAAVLREMKRLAEAVASGNLDVRGAPEAVSIEFRPVVQGLNETLDTFVAPLRLTAQHIDRIARGEIPEKVSSECRGEFERLRQNLNQCIADLESNRTRLAEAQQQLLRAERLSAMGSIAAGVAHEVNNPLSAVVSNLAYLAHELPAFVEMSERHSHDPALRDRASDLAEVLDEARAAARRVAVIVRDLAEVAPAEPATASRVDLTSVLETALALASQKLEDRVKVVCEMAPVPSVMAPETQLTRVFLHLILEAAQGITAKPPGSGEIHLATRVDERGCAVVEVRDVAPSVDGPSSDPGEASACAARPTSPSGLGMSVCHGIVVGLGGLLEVEHAAAGDRSLFRVILPAADDTRQRTEGTLAPA